ncbi:MAG TPA: alanine--glyoxylate aminotransferase family protein [Gemmatimonadaceae bacterium]|nr:alanine--glyoxylate aminotransferase family protein [Gemmatimonadaceae bacterium]
MTDTPNRFGTFFAPGPTEVRQEVLVAMTRPMIPHRSSAFEELFARLQAGLGYVFQTDRPVYVSASSATGMMEAGIRCSPPGPILSLVNGAFSERFAHIAEMCGRHVGRYEVKWGSVHEVVGLETYLTKTRYAAVTVVHSETSTGALNDIRALSDLAHSHGVTCLVDSVSGLGGAEVRTKEWQLDYVLTGSQKALALPPGLAFSTASAGFIESARSSEGRGVYFDLVEMDDFATRGQVPTTPALSLMYALDVQLEAIRQEGIENRWKRHTTMSEMTSQWLDKCRDSHIDLNNIVQLEFRSPTVSAIRLPKESSAAEFLRRVAERGIRVATGYGKLKSDTFRIGHMGDHSPATLEGCLAACEAAIRA